MHCLEYQIRLVPAATDYMDATLFVAGQLCMDSGRKHLNGVLIPVFARFLVCVFAYLLVRLFAYLFVCLFVGVLACCLLV